MQKWYNAMTIDIKLQIVTQLSSLQYIFYHWHRRPTKRAWVHMN